MQPSDGDEILAAFRIVYELAMVRPALGDFQHRNFAKWTLEGNRSIPGFRLERECLGFLADLWKRWAPGVPAGVLRWDARRADAGLRAIARALCSRRWDYARMGLDARTMRFLPDGSVGEGAAGCERWWNLRRVAKDGSGGGPVRLEVFGPDGLTFHVRRTGRSGWRGRWVIFERSRVALKPIPIRVKRKAKRAVLAIAAPGAVLTAKKRMAIVRR